MKKTLILVASALAAILIAVMIGYANQAAGKMSSETLLQRQVILSEQGNSSISSLVIEGLGSAKIPGGLIRLLNCDEPVKYTNLSKEASIRNVLEYAVAADPQYKWEIKEGVVNLIPQNGDPPLLDSHISHFRTKGAKTVHEALDQLLNTPELKAAINRLDIGPLITRGGIGYYGPPEGSAKELQVSGENISVRDALNAIVRAHGSAMWIYTQSNCNGKKSFTIDFSNR